MRAFHRENEAPSGLVSLLDMLRFNAHHFVAISNTLGAMTMDIASGQAPSPRSFKILSEHCALLKRACEELDLPISRMRIERFFADVLSGEPNLDGIRAALVDIQMRVWDELQNRLFLSLGAEGQIFYANPLRGWESAIGRFPQIRDDVEEASKCYALERYGGCIFHLMRVTEAAVIELGKFVDPNDYKPQLSSVIKKIENLTQKTKWQDWPPAAQPHKQLFVDVVPRLHAVKDSWRDKAFHFDEHIVPSEAVSNPERSREIYNATLSLVGMLADRMPR